MEAKSEGWASGESAADDGLGPERVEAMAKVKLGGRGKGLVGQRCDHTLVQ